MKDTVLVKLRSKMNEVIRGYSNLERDCNYNQETFSLESVDDFRVIGEYDAVVLLKKDTGKKSLFRFFYIKAKERWEYYVPKAAHVMDAKTRQIYEEVELYNGRHFMEANP